MKNFNSNSRIINLDELTKFLLKAKKKGAEYLTVDHVYTHLGLYLGTEIKVIKKKI